MPAVKRNLKKPAGPLTPSTLKAHCRAAGLTITGLAFQIGRSRQALYYAVENPRRFSPTYNLIRKALS